MELLFIILFGGFFLVLTAPFFVAEFILRLLMAAITVGGLPGFIIAVGLIIGLPGMIVRHAYRQHRNKLVTVFISDRTKVDVPQHLLKSFDRAMNG
ncbi:hypothetical protein ACFL04_00850 [Patescibacteria group bacterium]